MSGTLLGVIAVGLVVLSIFIWMNVAMVKSRAKSAHKNRADALVRDVEQTQLGSAPENVTVASVARPNSAGSTYNEPLTGEPIQAPLTSESRMSMDDTLEVLPAGTYRGSKKVFERSEYPFNLRTASVPAFREADWMQCFHRLTDDRRILGWIAFSEDIVGASDREYDHGFIDVLKNHWKSLEQLRVEVGMTHIRETSIVSDEGNVWILNAREDTWFALFVDSGADVHDISNRLLGPVIEP